ncbi:GNAT family N-acetyltransferase [Flaviramulus aquimarinus]|uniref:GNAT family N-acetyltransferase n=1 Tax=Flaviramulus aquimarinus TaxID=1170456 RepID=A0ABP9FBK2_9FLAO
MKYIKLNNTVYSFTSNIKHDKAIRTSFNTLTEASFGFNMEAWYQSGYWGDNYIAYSLLHENKIISNVSVSVIEFIIDKEKKIGIQLGTVMTDKNHRKGGLNKFIMEQVLNEWKEKADFIYLYANDSVLDFYPKFNFEIVDEYQYSKPVKDNSDISSIKKINIDNDNEKEFLKDILKNSIPISKVSMRNNTGLIMFYCLWIKKNSIYYIDTLKTIVIADFEGDTLYLNDVFTKEHVSLNHIIKAISNKYVKNVVLGFTPLDKKGYNKKLLKEEGTTLFVLKDYVDYFKHKHWMFPVLSHA